jgi:hypothetical protein
LIFKNDTKKLPIPPGKTLAKVPEHDTKTIYENKERGICNVSVQKPKKLS